MPAQFVPEPLMLLPDGLLDPRVELTTTQASDLAKVSKDTIERRLKSKLFPNARRRPRDAARRWLIPIGDLVHAGLLDASRVGDPEAHRRRENADDITAQLIAERATTQTLQLQIEMLGQQLAAKAEEVTFLRSMIAAAATAAA